MVNQDSSDFLSVVCVCVCVSVCADFPWHSSKLHRPLLLIFLPNTLKLWGLLDPWLQILAWCSSLGFLLERAHGCQDMRESLATQTPSSSAEGVCVAKDS